MKKIIILLVLVLAVVAGVYASNWSPYVFIVENEGVKLYAKIQVNSENTYVRWKVENNTDRRCQATVADKQYMVTSGGYDYTHPDVQSDVRAHDDYVFVEDIVQGEVTQAGATLYVKWL